MGTNLGLSERPNLLELKKEHWKPPVYRAEGPLGRVKLAILRLLDLQSGTIWRDLERELPQTNGTVLDVGCGIQPFRHMFGPATRYIGLDSKDSLAHFGYRTPDTLYYSGSRWPLKDRSVDFILCTETLEHIPEPGPFLKEAARCLKSGGRILLTVPFAARWHFIPYDYWRHTPSGLGLLLKGAGFGKVEVHARGNQFTVACYKVMAVFFSLLAPVSPDFLTRSLSRLAGILGLPFLGLAVLAANLSLGWDGTVDCLGYTVKAVRMGGHGR